jgi:hypothetical protein
MGNPIKGQKSADAWNANHPIGTPVQVCPIIGEPPQYRSRTRSGAWLLGHGQPVVMFDGKSGGYALEAVLPMSEAEYAASALPNIEEGAE